VGEHDYLQTVDRAEMVDRRAEGHQHDYVRSWIEWLHRGEHCNDTTHDSLQATQDRQSMYKHRVEHRCEIGDVVYLRV
jgi:hypothetical protein